MVFSEIVSKQTGFTLHKTHTPPKITANSVMRRIMRATLLRQVPCNFKIACVQTAQFVCENTAASLSLIKWWFTKEISFDTNLIKFGMIFPTSGSNLQ